MERKCVALHKVAVGKNGTTVCREIGGTGNHHVKRKKPDPERSASRFISYVELMKEVQALVHRLQEELWVQH